MSFQEEPESQIDFPLHQHTNERDSPPPFDCDPHGHANLEPSPVPNSDEAGSDDTVPDNNTAPISNAALQHDTLGSQVEDTQYVPIEYDTQPSMDYDISPMTLRVLNNIESSSANLPPPMMAMPLLEMRDTPALPDSPEFRFGKPPKPNSMKLTRPLPGPNRPRQIDITNTEALTPQGNLTVNDRVAPSSTVRTLTSRSSPPKGTFTHRENLDSTLPAPQAELNHLTDHAVARNNETVEVGPRSQLKIIEPVSGPRSRPEEVSPRNKRPFEEPNESSNTTMHTRPLATFKPHSITNHNSRSPGQPGRQAKSKSPPFIEAALSSNRRPEAAGIPTAATVPENAPCASNDLEAPRRAEIQSSQPNRSESRSVAEPVATDIFQGSLIPRNQTDQPGNAAQTLPDGKVHKQVDYGDILRPAVSDRDLPESSHDLRDLLTHPRPRSRNKNSDSYTSRYGTTEVPTSAPPRRPLTEHQLQPQHIRQNQDIHSTRDSRVSKRGLPRAKSAYNMQSNVRIPMGVSETITSAEMMQMAAVIATAEKEQRKQVVAKTQLQEVQIVNLGKANSALQNQIECLSKDNQELVEKHAGFRARCEKYKANMNDVMRAQKELHAAAVALDKRKFDVLKQTSKEMDADTVKAKALASGELRAIMKEARLKLDRQDKMIELLNRDINNRLLDLQRERGLKESLQKQLENREKQQEELKLALSGHQESTAAILSGHQDMLKEVMSAGADSTVRLNECRALLTSLNESEPKPIPALIELNELVVALSASVEKKFQAAEDGIVQVREASVEVIAELKDRLKIINEDHSAQRKLNATIADLREKNATLKGKLQSRDTEFSGIERQFKEIKQELQNCRDQLAVTSDELSKALSVPREDPLLRTQLQDLQSSYSIIKDQADSSASETESLRAGLHKQEKLTLLAQQEASKLQDKLRQSEAKVSAFSAQKDAYVRQVKEESDMLRLQMERDVRARRAEDEARNNDNVSGLRRQITEADNKLAQTKQKLHDMEKMSSSKEAEAHRLSTNISAVATELGCLQEKYRIMEQNRDSMVNELSISKEQLIRYMEQAGECSAQAEENALEFAKRSKEIDDGIEKSGKVAEVEVERFEALVLMLQKKNEDSEIVNSNVARYLHSIGLLKPGLTFTEWAVRLPGEQFQQDERNLDPSRLSFIGEPFGVSALIRESYAYGSRNECGTSTVSSNNKEAPLVVPEDNSERLACEYVSHDANGSSALLDDDRRKALPENESSLLTSYSKSSSKSMSPVNHKHEHQLNTSSLELTSTSRTLSNIPQPFPATEATPRSYLRASDSFHDSNIRLGGIKRLEGTASSVVPESQEELTKEQIPNFARPTRRVAERRHSMAEGNRTITRTEVTGYSILTSKTYVDTPAARHNGMGSLSFGDVATDLKSVDLDTDSSSVMSDPPDGVENVDFTEFMDSCDGRDREDPVILRFSDKKAYADSMVSHPVLSPKPNSSRVRTGPPVRPEEIKPPKSILKRTNTMIPTNDTAVNAQLSGKTLKNTQLSKVQGIHKGTGPKRRSSRTMCGINGRDDATYGSSYNRMVTGSKVLHSSNNFQAHDVPPQLQGPSAANVFAISSSPAMGQPQRNSKKRALSGVGINDSNRPAKLQRLVRH